MVSIKAAKVHLLVAELTLPESCYRGPLVGEFELVRRLFFAEAVLRIKLFKIHAISGLWTFSASAT